jgi:hypothetical protein
MTRRLSKLEIAVAEISSVAVAMALPTPPGLGGFIGCISAYLFAQSTLVIYLLMIKNSGGWPE